MAKTWRWIGRYNLCRLEPLLPHPGFRPGASWESVFRFMLVRVLSVAADGLEETVFGDLVTNAVVEHQRLEYKSQLPGTSPDDRREFSRDVAAMANGGGGIIAIGIEEDANDAAARIAPVGLGGEITRLSQICNSLIEPHLLIDIHEVEIGGGPEGVIVVEVPSSARLPFAVAEGSRLGYYRRTGRNRHPLSEAEVAQMYQMRGIRFESATSRLDSLISRIPERLGDEPLPAMYVAVIPLEPYERLFRPDRDTLAEIRTLHTPPVFGANGVGDVLFPDLRPGFKRIDLARGYEDTTIRRYGWMEFHDDGAFLGVSVADEDLQRGMADLQEDHQAVPGFYDSRMTCEMVARLTAFGVLGKHFDVHGEIMITAGIVVGGSPATVTTGPGRYEADHTQVVATSVRTTSSADVEDLGTSQGVLRTAAPLLDDLMTAFAWPRCHQLERDGTVRIGFWGQGWNEIERWAEREGLSVTHEQ